MAVTKNIQGFEAEQEEFEACAECTQKCRSSHKKGNNNNNNYGSPSCFFKVLLGDFANVLRIPPAFVGRLQIGFQNAFLEGPSGQIWLVAVCRTDTGMTFEKGWQTFVSDHSLDVGDFLVFKYVGESYFTVQIFGRTCCEKKDAYTVRKSEPCRMSDGPKKQQKCREGSAEISHGVSDDACIDPRNMTNRVSQGHELPTSAPFIKSNTVQVDNSRKREQCINSKDSVGSEEDMTKVESTGFLDKGNEAGFSVGKAVFLGAEGESTKKALKKVTPVQPIKKTKITSQKLQTPKNGGKRRVSAHYVYCSQPVKKTKVTPQKLQTPMDEGKQYVSAHYVSCRREVTQKERENALKAAQSFQSDNPFNLIVMKQSQVYQGFWLSLSRDFSKRWLPDRRIEITLLGPCGNKWPVQYLGDRSNPGLSGGWKGFAIDKNLEEGDVCVFELENKENCVLKVHIYRVVEDCTPPRKVEGVRRKNEESEKKSVPVKKLSTKKRDTADTNKEKKRPQSTPNSGIKTEPQQVKANQGSPSVTSDAFKTVPKMEM